MTSPSRPAWRARRGPPLPLILAFAVLSLAAQVRAEEATPSAASSAEAAPASAATAPATRGSVLAAGVLPAAYGQEGKGRENALRRFEIVALGSYPIMLFYTGLGFDLSAYIGSGYDPSRAPWPFKSEYSAELSDAERLQRLGTAALASLFVAGLDAAIHEVRLRREERAARRLFEGRPGSPP